MKRALLLLSVLPFLVCAQPARHENQPARASFGVCVQVGGDTYRTLVVGPEAKKLSKRPDDWTKGQIRNAILGVLRERGQDISSELVVRFDEPAVSTEPMRMPPVKGGGYWDTTKPGRCWNCICANAVYDGKKQFVGCNMDSCDGCMICRPC